MLFQELLTERIQFKLFLGLHIKLMIPPLVSRMLRNLEGVLSLANVIRADLKEIVIRYLLLPGRSLSGLWNFRVAELLGLRNWICLEKLL